MTLNPALLKEAIAGSTGSTVSQPKQTRASPRSAVQSESCPYRRGLAPGRHGQLRAAGLTALALVRNARLSEYSGYLENPGRIEAVIGEAVRLDVLSAARFVRFRSREEHTFAEKMLSAIGRKFGGHLEPVIGKKSAEGENGNGTS
jgi:hypothetical protein